MQELIVLGVCANCSGTGGVTSGPPGQQVTDDCTWPGCNGTGSYKIASIVIDPGLDDIMDKLNDVLDKCNDILSEVTG